MITTWAVTAPFGFIPFSKAKIEEVSVSSTHLFFQKLRSHPRKSVYYTRMSVEMFVELLVKVSPFIRERVRHGSVFRQTISRAEHLTITLRYLSQGVFL